MNAAELAMISGEAAGDVAAPNAQATAPLKPQASSLKLK